MGNRYILTPEGELYHWGIKGMKWGQRRWQNKDGSLTPAGKKRYAQEEADLKAREKAIKNREREAAKRAKLDSKKAELDAREAALNGGGKKTAPSAPRQKTISDLTNDELRELTTRMNVERDFYNARASLAAANPKQVSRGKKFVNSLVNDALAPAAISVGKSWMENTLRKKLGLESVKTLEDRWKKADYKKKIAEAERDLAKIKSGKSDEKPDWEKESKRLQYEDNEAKRETNRLNREIDRMKAEQLYAKQKEEYDAWLEEEERRRRRELGDGD